LNQFELSLMRRAACGARGRELMRSVGTWRGVHTSLGTARAKITIGVARWTRRALVCYYGVWAAVRRRAAGTRVLLRRCANSTLVRAVGRWRGESALWSATRRRRRLAVLQWHGGACSTSIRLWRGRLEAYYGARLALSTWSRRAVSAAIRSWHGRLEAYYGVRLALSTWSRRAVSRALRMWSTPDPLMVGHRAASVALSRLAGRSLRYWRAMAAASERVASLHGVLRRRASRRANLASWRRWMGFLERTRTSRMAALHRQAFQTSLLIRRTLEWRDVCRERASERESSRRLSAKGRAAHYRRAFRSWCALVAAQKRQARQAFEQLAGLSQDFAEEISASQKLINHWEHRKWQVDVSTSGWVLAPLAQASSSRKRSPLPPPAAEQRYEPDDYSPAARLLFAEPAIESGAQAADQPPPPSSPALAPSTLVLVPSTPTSPPVPGGIGDSLRLSSTNPFRRALIRQAALAGTPELLPWDRPWETPLQPTQPVGMPVGGGGHGRGEPSDLAYSCGRHGQGLNQPPRSHASAEWWSNGPSVDLSALRYC
jgi:hypothetical protein